MTRGIAMRRCTSCGHVAFPPRVLCPRCGGGGWRRVLAMSGTVEEVTRRRPRRRHTQTPLPHRIPTSEFQLASVRSDLGPVITVAGRDGDLEPGMRVALESEGSASVAREATRLQARPSDPESSGRERSGARRGDG